MNQLIEIHSAKEDPPNEKIRWRVAIGYIDLVINIYSSESIIEQPDG
jgi:hypothetical protein